MICRGAMRRCTIFYANKRSTNPSRARSAAEEAAAWACRLLRCAACAARTVTRISPAARKEIPHALATFALADSVDFLFCNGAGLRRGLAAMARAAPG